MNLERIVSKRAASVYRAGERTRDWLKVKCWRRELFVVGGLERDADGRLVSLLVGTPEGERLRYEGRVEFALGRVESAWRSAPETGACPFDRPFHSRSIVWLEPRTIIETRALPRTIGTPLRHGTAIRVAASI